MRIGGHNITFHNSKLHIDNKSIEFDEAYIIWRLIDNQLQNLNTTLEPIDHRNIRYLITVDLSSSEYLIYRGKDPVAPELLFKGNQVELSIFSFFLSRILTQGISLWINNSTTEEKIDNTIVDNQPLEQPQNPNKPYNINQQKTDQQDDKFLDAIMFLHGVYTAYKNNILNFDKPEMLNRVNSILQNVFGLSINLTGEVLRSYLSYVDSVLQNDDILSTNNPTIQKVLDLFEKETDEVKKKGYKAIALFLIKAETLSSINITKHL